MKHIAIIVNKNNNYGLAKDAELLKESWIAWGRAHGSHGLKVSIKDPREPCEAVDVVVFLEVPHPVWFPWAAVRVMMVNGEWWMDTWNEYVASFDIVIFKTEADKAQLAHVFANKPSHIIRWKGTLEPREFVSKDNTIAGWVWFVGGSANKIAAAKKILPLWTADMPPVKVYTTADLAFEEDGIALAKNVSIAKAYITPAQHRTAAAAYKGHICCSQAESFGFVAAEAVAAGAYMMINDIPAYSEYYGKNSSAYTIGDLSGVTRDVLLAAGKALLSADEKAVKKSQRAFCDAMKAAYETTFAGLATMCAQAATARQLGQLPPVVKPEDCPPISVLVPLKNYQNFINLILYNVMTTDYPLEKLEIVICDATPMQLSKAPVILQMGQKIEPAKLTYIPVDNHDATIGELRNMCVRYAAHDILVHMDADDYYPPTSFRRRVSWLKSNPDADCVTITGVPGYCLQTARSFMTIPPYALSMAQRISEASLCYKRSFWDERRFPEGVAVSEGEGFLVGRTAGRVLEIPAGQIVVSFLHGKNTSGRYIPDESTSDSASKKPTNAWGFSPAELRFFHGLAGVEIEEVGGK
jgi:hypothetical protein